MTILNSADLNLIRSRQQRTEMFLSIYVPTLIFEAQVNDANIGKDAREITYNNVTVGSYTDIFENAQMLVFQSVSDTDIVDAIGSIRVRSATPTQITVAENSHINWADNYIIRIYNYVDVEAIYPRIINDPADDENVIFYKDYDIAYTNQNSILGTFVCAGPHRAGFTGEQLYWGSSGTYNVAGSAMTYSWIFEGGSITGSTSANPGYVTYNTPGHYKTTLRVTNASGTYDTTYRFVSIYDRPGYGSTSTEPVKNWEMQEINGSRSGGGYTAHVKIRGAIRSVPDNALVVIWTEDWYNDTKRSLGGNFPNTSQIFFVGYVVKGSVSHNYYDDYVDFTLGSIAEAMKNAEGFSVSCENKTSPATWFEIKDLSIQRALYHYLHWHSTVLNVADFQYTGDDRVHQYFDTDRSSLFDAINNFLGSAIMGELVTDRQGKLWAEIHPKVEHNARTAYSTALNIGRLDWINTPYIEDRQLKETSFIELGGIRYNAAGGATGTSIALLSNAPGLTPSYRGKARSIEGLVLTSQSQLNNMAGDLYAYENSKYPIANIDLMGNYNHLDIAPLEKVVVDLSKSDTPRGIAFTDEPFHINSIRWSYSAANQKKMASLELAQLVNGVAGDTIPVPLIPDGDGFGVPPITVPPIGGLGGGGGTTSFIYGVYNSWGLGASATLGSGPIVGDYAYNRNSGKNLSESNGVVISSTIDLGDDTSGKVTMTPTSGGLYMVLANFNIPPYNGGDSAAKTELELIINAGPTSVTIANQTVAHVYSSILSAGSDDLDTVQWSGMVRIDAGDSIKLIAFINNVSFSAWYMRHVNITLSIFRVAD